MKAKYIEGSTSAEMRNTYITESFGPISNVAFKDNPLAQSLVLAIGQYWADEADDAVHLALIPCIVSDPVWPDCLQDNPFVEDGWVDWKAFDAYTVGQKFPQLDENTNAITAFASCCHELTSQEEPLADTSKPYAIARRSGKRTRLRSRDRWISVETRMGRHDQAGPRSGRTGYSPGSQTGVPRQTVWTRPGQVSAASIGDVSVPVAQSG